MRVVIFLVLFALAPVAVGCTTVPEWPVAPTAAPPVPTPTPSYPPETKSWSGRVVDPEGQPVAGAELEVWRNGENDGIRYTATSDADGRYQLSAPARYVTAGVTVRREGFETAHHYFVMADVVSAGRDFLLRPIIEVQAGETVALVVGRADSVCGIDGELVCRIVRIRAPHAGALTVAASPDVRLWRGFFPWPSQLAVAAGEVVLVEAGVHFLSASPTTMHLQTAVLR